MMKLLKPSECLFSGGRGNDKEQTMIVEEQGIGFWTRVQIPSAPLWKNLVTMGKNRVVTRFFRVLKIKSDHHKYKNIRLNITQVITQVSHEYHTVFHRLKWSLIFPVQFFHTCKKYEHSVKSLKILSFPVVSV